MSRIVFLGVIILGCIQATHTQTVEISGRVKSDVNVENIHVINKTGNFFTITNSQGAFKIKGKLNDTLQFSSIQHKEKYIIITNQVIFTKAVLLSLDEQINELDEVIVGKVLTGNLLLDINNVEGKPPVNFYDVGIPGYTGRPKTQSERRLSEASEFKPSLGSMTSIPVLPIINAITGRTKMLKNRVKVETTEALMQSIKSRLSKDFFASNPLEEDLRIDFFYFCADDEHFMKYCKNQSDFDILVFLRHKYKQYMTNKETTDD